MTRISVTKYAALLIAVLSACGRSSPADDAGDLLTCYDASVVVVTRLADEARLLAACSVDADCTATPIHFECPDQDVIIDSCPLPLAVESTSAFAARRAAAADELCASFEPSCRSSSTCENVESHCVDGACELMPVAP